MANRTRVSVGRPGMAPSDGRGLAVPTRRDDSRAAGGVHAARPGWGVLGVCSFCLVFRPGLPHGTRLPEIPRTHDDGMAMPMPMRPVLSLSLSLSLHILLSLSLSLRPAFERDTHRTFPSGRYPPRASPKSYATSPPPGPERTRFTPRHQPPVRQLPLATWRTRV